MILNDNNYKGLKKLLKAKDEGDVILGLTTIENCIDNIKNNIGLVLCLTKYVHASMWKKHCPKTYKMLISIIDKNFIKAHDDLFSINPELTLEHIRYDQIIRIMDKYKATEEMKYYVTKECAQMLTELINTRNNTKAAPYSFKVVCVKK